MRWEMIGPLCEMNDTARSVRSAGAVLVNAVDTQVLSIILA
jgi:hypothetical protein